MNATTLRTLKHELRTPINHIIGYSELLLESALDDGVEVVAEQAKALQADGHQLAALVENHLAKASGDSGDFNPSDLSNATAPVISRMLKNSSVLNGQIISSWQADVVRIQSATARLAQMIGELGEHL